MTITKITHRLTADEFEQLSERGIYSEDDRIELINGHIRELPPIGGYHVDATSRLTRVLSRQVSDDYLVQVQSPIRLSDDHEPMPDLAIVRDRAYGRQLPTAADVVLIIEVADSTLRYDRQIKAPLYAAAGIPEYWLVSVNAVTIDRYSDPQNGQYQQRATFRRGDILTSLTLPNLTVTINQVLL